MHIRYGIPWGVLKDSLLERSPFVLPGPDGITDDSVVDPMNLGIFLERYGRPSLTKNRDRDVDQI
jgi:hypothetical protein